MPLEHQIIASLEKAHRGDAWYGPSTESLLAGITARQAALRPVAGAHSIWELVLHITAWQNEVSRRLKGAAPAWPEEGDWQEISDPSEEAWERAKAALDASTRRLEQELAAPAVDYSAPIGTARERALGTGVSAGETVLGLLQHNAYHTGQIALLRRALEI